MLRSSPGGTFRAFNSRANGENTVRWGFSEKPLEIDFEQIAYKELQVSGFISQKWTAWQTALRLLKEKKVNLEPLISQELALEDWREGFESKEKGQVFKTLLYSAG